MSFNKSVIHVSDIKWLFFPQFAFSSSSCSHTPIPIGRPSSYPPSSKGTPQVSDVSPLSLSTTPPEVSYIVLCPENIHTLPPQLSQNVFSFIISLLNVFALASPHSLGISSGPSRGGYGYFLELHIAEKIVWECTSIMCLDKSSQCFKSSCVFELKYMYIYTVVV